MNRKYKFLAIYFFLFCFSVFLCPIFAIENTNVIKTDDPSIIKKYIEQYSLQNKQALVIWDVDDVLMMPIDQICISHNKKTFDSCIGEYKKFFSEEELEEILSVALLQRSIQVVDKEIVKIINSLNSTNRKVIALTNAWTGKYGKINSLEDWRINELKDLGYNFSNSFPKLPTKTFDDLKSKDSKRFPMYKSGILWTCNLSKEIVLSKFLEYSKFEPDMIIFIDDKEKHILSVKNFCKEGNIKFIGINYTGSNKFIDSLDKITASIQIYNLIHNKIWISSKDVINDDQIISPLKCMQ